jgi:HlyD family secretion protein
MKRFIPLILIAIVIGGGLFYWYKIRPAKEQDVSKLYGNVEIREVEASFRQNGRIAKINVDEGDKVIEGQIIAELDPDTFEQALESANAEIYSANAQYEKLKTGSRPQEIKQAQAQFEQTTAVFENAQKEYNRQASLLPSGSVSQRIVDAAKTQLEQAKATNKAAAEALDLAKTGARKEDIATGYGRVLSAQAAKTKLETALDDTKLRSPATGTIIARNKESGSVIAAGTPIYTVSLDSPVYVRAYAPENALGRIPAGTMVEVKSDGNDKIYHGQIGFVSPKAEFTPKSVETEDLRTDLVYRIRIVIKDNDGRLLQGMPVSISIPAVQKAK